MNFSATIAAMRNGSKSESRRIAKPYHRPIFSPDGKAIVAVRSCRSDGGPTWIDRLLWEVGRTYAVQAGRHAKSEGRFRLEYIKHQMLQCITEEEAIREGYEISISRQGVFKAPVQNFAQLWDEVHTRVAEQWCRNPYVWVLGIGAVTWREREGLHFSR